MRLQAGRLGDRDPVLDLLLARGGEHDFHVFGAVGGRADDVEVEADLVERERDVLAGLGLDLHFELVLGQAGRQHDLLGDHRGRRHAQRDVLGAGAALFPQPAHRFGHAVDVFDVAVDDGVARQRSTRSAPARMSPLPASASSTRRTAEVLMSSPIAAALLAE